MDSVFQGYAYCNPYDDDFTTDAPFLARIAGIAALIFGTYALSVLWAYLLLGAANEVFWMWAVRCLWATVFCQILTMMFFVGAVCQRDSCTFGPGAWVSAAGIAIWLLVGYEMRRNSPVAKIMSAAAAAARAAGEDMGGCSGVQFVHSSVLPRGVVDLMDAAGVRSVYDKHFGGRDPLRRDLPSLSRVSRVRLMHRATLPAPPADSDGVKDLGGYQPPHHRDSIRTASENSGGSNGYSYRSYARNGTNV